MEIQVELCDIGLPRGIGVGETGVEIQVGVELFVEINV